MLRSLLLLVDASSIRRVASRVAQLPLSDDARLTVVEAPERMVLGRSLVELLAIGVVALQRRIRWTTASEGGGLPELARDADLVVLGHDGAWGPRIGDLVGRVPILRVGTEGGAAYQRTVVAVAPREGTEEVLRFASVLLPAPRPAMTAVHVSGVVAQGRRLVAALLASCGAFGAGWTRYFTHGCAREAIARVAHSTSADLVVIGSRPRSSIGVRLFGSVSRHALRSLPCDVLAVPSGAPVEAR